MQRLAEITVLCETLHCLPRPGGLFDQDAYLVLGMQAVLVARNEKQEQELKKSASRTA